MNTNRKNSATAACEPRNRGIEAKANEASRGAARTDESIVVPVVEEQLQIDRHTVETGKLLIHKTLREHEQIVDLPLLQEEADIERIPVNRIVAAPVAIREENGTIIIPLMEEVLVVEKKLLFREELHIKKRRTQSHEPRTFKLRSEQVDIERQRGEPSAH